MWAHNMLAFGTGLWDSASVGELVNVRESLYIWYREGVRTKEECVFFSFFLGFVCLLAFVLFFETSSYCLTILGRMLAWRIQTREILKL